MKYPEPYYFKDISDKVPEGESLRRLTELAAFLKTVPDKLFRYNVVLNSKAIPTKSVPAMIEDMRSDLTKAGAITKVCGAVGCAMGWSYILFKDLIAVDNRSGLLTITEPNGWVNIEINAYNWELTATLLFGLPASTARKLFAPNDSFLDDYPAMNSVIDVTHYRALNTYATAVAVSERIAEYAKTGKVLMALPTT